MKYAGPSGTDVRAGRLRVLLPDQPGEPAPLSMICPHRRQFSPAVRQLHALVARRRSTGPCVRTGGRGATVCYRFPTVHTH